MGNWSCLYHWLEFASPRAAASAYRRLQEVGAYLQQETTADKRTVRFGYLDATTLQIISSQKWGLDADIAWWVCKDLKYRAIVQSGIDRDCLFQVHGSPETVVPLYDRFLCIDWQPPQPGDLPGVQSHRNGWIRLAQPVCFSLAHFNESELAAAGPYAALIRSICDQFKAQKDATEGRVAFGRCIGNRALFLGSLYMESDGIVFTTTGCHNGLMDEITLGPYATPIDDEHEPIHESQE